MVRRHTFVCLPAAEVSVQVKAAGLANAAENLAALRPFDQSRVAAFFSSLFSLLHLHAARRIPKRKTMRRR